MANGNPVILGNADTSTKQTTISALTPAKDAALRVQNYSGTGIAAGALKGVALTASVANTPAGEIDRTNPAAVALYNRLPDVSKAIPAGVFR